MKKSKSLRASPLECTDISEGPWAVYPLKAELAAAWGPTQDGLFCHSVLSGRVGSPEFLNPGFYILGTIVHKSFF